MSRYTESSDYNDIWAGWLFTNYVQFFLQRAVKDMDRPCKSDLSERDYAAFNETLQELQPDVVVVWGDVLSIIG